LCTQSALFTRLYKDAWSTKHKVLAKSCLKETTNLHSFLPTLFLQNVRNSVLPLEWNMMSIIYIRNTAKTLRNCSTSYKALLTHQLKAFSKTRNHGDTVYLLCQLAGSHGHCHSCVQRSGWGIIARWRPSSEHIPATPPAEHGKIQWNTSCYIITQ